MKKHAGLIGVGTLASIPLAVATMPSAALADAVYDPPITLDPIKPSTGEVQPNGTPGTAYRCRNTGTLRRRATSFVIGYCMANNRIDISSTAITQGWQGGHAYGNYNNCGWFLLANGLDVDGSYNYNCGNTTYAESYFANKINTSADSGYPVSISKNCDVYANVRPWEDNTTGFDKLGTLNKDADGFDWRYRSKNDNWVLGLWRHGGATDWGFVQNSCVATPPDSALRDPSTVPPPP